MTQGFTHCSLDIVWSDEKQTGLIDSILRNYYMPPIIFGKAYLLSLSLPFPDRVSLSCLRAGGRERAANVH